MRSTHSWMRISELVKKNRKIIAIETKLINKINQTENHNYESRLV